MPCSSRAPLPCPVAGRYTILTSWPPVGEVRAGWLPYLPARHSSSAIQQPTSVICAMSASFPSSLFPAAESNPVSHLDEDHLFKRTKNNLEYMNYGQHKYSLLYLTVFCFLTLAYSRCFKEISPCCCLQMTVHSVARCLERGHMWVSMWMSYSPLIACAQVHVSINQLVTFELQYRMWKWRFLLIYLKKRPLC